MKFGPLEITDRKGRTVILRNAEITDAEDLLRYLKITTGETPYLVREPEEVTLTLEQERRFIQQNTDAERELLLIATMEGNHVGNCSLNRIGSYRRYAHRCAVSIALYKEYCGFGIGRRMMEALLDVAERCGYEQAELEVLAANENAVALYEKLGFQTYGRLPRNMKYADGTYAEAYWMMKIFA